MKVRYAIGLGVLAITLGVGIVAIKPPRGLFALFLISGQVCPGAEYWLEPTERVIALTIDDGPDEIRVGSDNTTQQILKVLADHQSQATFFLISNRITPQSQPLVAQMVREGHELGNHLTADIPSIQRPLKTFEAEVDEADRAIFDAAKAKTAVNWLRPGGGFCNQQMAEVIQKRHRIALGSIWPYDTLIASSQFSTWHILANARPGAIIVLHDHGPNREWGKRTVQTLQRVLPELKRQGYRVTTLSDASRAYGYPRP